MSALESAVSTLIGYLVAVASQFLIYPLFGFAISLSQSIEVAAYFTIISLIRSYLVRRAFNFMEGKHDDA